MNKILKHTTCSPTSKKPGILAFSLNFVLSDWKTCLFVKPCSANYIK